MQDWRRVRGSGPDTRWCRDSSCVKYVRNPGTPAAFALVTALQGRVCKTVSLPSWCIREGDIPAASGQGADGRSQDGLQRLGHMESNDR